MKKVQLHAVRDVNGPIMGVDQFSTKKIYLAVVSNRYYFLQHIDEAWGFYDFEKWICLNARSYAPSTLIHHIISSIGGKVYEFNNFTEMLEFCGYKQQTKIDK